MRMVYQYLGDDPAAFRTGYQEVVRSEFYGATIGPIAACRSIDVMMTRLCVEGIDILCQRANIPMLFRRSSRDVSDRVDVYMIWMVLEGSVILRRERETFTVEAGSCLLIRTNRPFLAVGKEQRHRHRSIQIVVSPAAGAQLGLPKDLGDKPNILDRDDAQSRRLFAGIYDRFGSYAYVPSPALFSELKSFVQAVVLEFSFVQERSAWERVDSEFQRLAYTPNISAELLADRCGISRRQLFYLFSSRKVSFAGRLRQMRLQTAYELITAIAPAKVSVESVSRLTGFKSAGHFSRSFKKQFGRTPGECRHEHSRSEQVFTKLRQGNSSP